MRFVLLIGLLGVGCSTSSAPPDAEPAAAPSSRPAASQPSGAPSAEEVGFCGGIAGFACSEGEYCHYPDGECGEGDRAGQCETRPQVCTMDYDPVCGCDGTTYPNACGAAAAGVSLRAPAPCSGAEE